MTRAAKVPLRRDIVLERQTLPTGNLKARAETLDRRRADSVRWKNVRPCPIDWQIRRSPAQTGLGVNFISLRLKFINLFGILARPT
jgi:hypothetical protein